MFLATSSLPVLDQQQIDRPAGERDLRPGGLENLVRRHDDAAVGLEADLELVPLVGGTLRRQKDRRGQEQRRRWR